MEDNQQNRGKKFVRDLGIYAVGNLGSKLITFLLVPLYTYFIAEADYGYYDLCLTVIFMMSPLVSMQLFDGSYRFLMDTVAGDPEGERQRKAIVTFVYKALVCNTLIAIALVWLFGTVRNLDYLGYFIVLFAVITFYDVIIRIVRGMGHTKRFVAAGIISAFAIGLFSVIFVAIMGLGVEGIFLANIAGRVAAILYLELRCAVLRKYFRWSCVDKTIIKGLLKYSLPLVPGSICWWLVESNNKFFIEHFLGLDQNGVFAVALKFASVLQVVAFIFYQAWQENAIQQYNSPDRDSFFTKVFNNYVYLLSALVLTFPFAIKMCYGWLVAPNYASSGQYLYLLAMSAMTFSLAAFFDMGYQCAKNTARALPGVVLAALINFVGNYLLIGPLQVYGVVICSTATYFILYIYRAIDTRRYFKIGIRPKTIIIAVVVVANAFIFQYLSSVPVIAAYLTAEIILLWYFAPEDIKEPVARKLHLPCKRQE